MEKDLLRAMDYQCVKCGRLEHGWIPSSPHRKPNSGLFEKKCDGAWKSIKTEKSEEMLKQYEEPDKPKPEKDMVRLGVGELEAKDGRLSHI